MILIGSRAAKYHFSDYRNPKDWDFVCTHDEFIDWLNLNINNIKKKRVDDGFTKAQITDKQNNVYEFVFTTPESSNELLTELCRKWTCNLIIPCFVADPVLLYLIKKSHVHQPIWWGKSIQDYHFLKTRVDEPTEAQLEFFELRKSEVDARSKKLKINLNMTNEDFFEKSNGAIKRVYEHDDLHAATCYYDKPLYDSLKLDKNKAAISKKLFFKLSYEDQLRTVREECYAIALERKLIPLLESGIPPLAIDIEKAFMYALERVSTTLTSGWFREFAIENHFSIKEVDKNFLDDFLNSVSNGLIKRLK